MPVVIMHLVDAIEAGGDGVSRTASMSSPPGTTVIAAGGRPALWDSEDGEIYEWFDSMCSVVYMPDPNDPSTVNFFMQRNGNRQALKNAWISYWED